MAPSPRARPPGLPKIPRQRMARTLLDSVSPQLMPHASALPTPRDLDILVKSRSILLRRSREAIKHYLPLPSAIPFHRSTAMTRLLGGSNQSGKSQAGAAEMAWLLTGTHPFNRTSPKTGGLYYAVGYDEKHISNLMWPKLSREGQIRLIRDEVSREWRAWDPTREYDREYADKTVPAQPFLPERLIAPKGISWYSKKDDCPKSVRLKNGSELQFYTSKGYAQKGTQIDGAWIDEECERDGWHAELLARCIKRRGLIWWSATPEISTPQFFRLRQKSIKPRPGDGSEKPVESFWMLIDDNPYPSDRDKAEFKAGLPEKLVAVKYYGIFAVAGLLVYPEFSPSLHCVKTQVLPADWTRYLVVDPGRRVCAVLFAAIPPDAQSVHVYRELYIRNCSSAIFGQEVASAMGEYRNRFEAFLIDYRMGRQTEMGSGRTVVEQYAEALEMNHVQSRATGNRFLPGSSDILGREGSLRAWMEINPRSGLPTIRIHDCCEVLMWEIEQQFYEKTKGEVDDRKRADKDNHLVTDLEYLAAFDPPYVPPLKGGIVEENVFELDQRLERERNKNRPREESITLGPQY